MNIFVLDLDPFLAARYHCDKHVVKMTLETAQLVCTVLHGFGIQNTPYRPTHKNHPCALWAKQSRANLTWLLYLGESLGAEYSYRYGDKEHASSRVISWCRYTLNQRPDLQFPEKSLTPFALAMPEQYKSPDPVWSYRAYYLGEKHSILTYRRRQTPRWIQSWIPDPK